MVHLGDNLPKGKDQEKIQGHLSCRSYFLESNSAVCLRVRLKNQAPGLTQAQGYNLRNEGAEKSSEHFR